MTRRSPGMNRNAQHHARSACTLSLTSTADMKTISWCAVNIERYRKPATASPDMRAVKSKGSLRQKTARAGGICHAGPDERHERPPTPTTSRRQQEQARATGEDAPQAAWSALPSSRRRTGPEAWMIRVREDLDPGDGRQEQPGDAQVHLAQAAGL